MFLCTSIEIAGILTTYCLAHALQPMSRPCELDTQYRQADRDHDNGGSGRHQHDQPDHQDGHTDQCHRDAARDFIGKVDGVPDQTKFPKILILLSAIVASGE